MDDKMLCRGGIKMAKADGVFLYRANLGAEIADFFNKESVIRVYDVDVEDSASVIYTETEVAEYLIEEAFYASMGV